MATQGGKAVAYYRLMHTPKGRPSASLEAQRDLVNAYLGPKAVVIGEFTEVEQGSMDERPALERAIKLAKRERATLVVGTVQRLMRDRLFNEMLLDDSKLKFVCAEYPSADRAMLKMRQQFAEWEAERKGENIKVSLDEARKRGVKLGSPNPKIGSAAGSKRLIEKADAYAEKVAPTVREILRKTKGGTLRDIAAALTRQGVETPRGNVIWYPSQVTNLLKRMKK